MSKHAFCKLEQDAVTKNVSAAVDAVMLALQSSETEARCWESAGKHEEAKAARARSVNILNALNALMGAQ